jgi:hypothetical protein
MAVLSLLDQAPGGGDLTRSVLGPEWTQATRQRARGEHGAVTRLWMVLAVEAAAAWADGVAAEFAR